MPDEEQPGEPEVLDGPDPREWPIKSPEMWSLVLDIEALERIRRAMNGPVVPVAEQDHEEARQFLDHADRQLRATLGAMIIDTYQVPRSSEPRDTSPFGGAGKPRAFGAEHPPPPSGA